MAASTAPASSSGIYADPREDWLAQYAEEIIDPARPIVDPHHHLWDRGGLRYMIEEMSQDIASGHNIVATVYVDCRSMYRAGGPEAFRPVGEVEFANGVAAMSASGAYGKALICAGIVSHVDLRLGEDAKPVLEAEIAAGNGRFRGIRHASAWDADPDVAGMYAKRPKGLLLDPTSKCDNVVVKLGGLAMCLLGYDFHLRPRPPSSEELAAAWRPYIETCIEAFGPNRCMFESNFPPDKGQCSYQVIFNAFKRLSAQYGEAEKTALFTKTAADVYRLDIG